MVSARLTTDDLLQGTAAVIVDWDGTVVDSQDANFAALSAALLPYGVSLDRPWYEQHVGLSIADLLTEVAAIHGDLPTSTIIEASRARLLASLDQLQPVAATIELLDAATDRGLPCAVASGAARVLVEGGIRALNLGHLFTATITRENVACGKPAPELFLHAAGVLAVDARRCLAVDDAADGIAAARAAGMRVLTVRQGRLVPTHVPAVVADPS
ncbi:HAD superfamily hydrolase (TIGR01509 family) [Actinoplanes campanulatus]|uniref:HAD superfamily hydrolase (TIGR01509 family) n=1 Tax=Actinoplanes campanulatus TaxID=113559 RepID=A0A7W5FGU2_9ACTN|nr:HAD family phosphatase [Actinoplanes campanulatus]MBB3097795.1 HAD superfamily hydrolase (TIGR01509 family) [Actinoplanes campanulatus]GGN38353.1 haloacid dehalogenase [Actinoplanes campanulatus]GID39636.1 haloacid dehalogenase [Actinoplanes campanulatus]